MTGGFGAFGKMPSVGDFFRINLPAAFVTAWDTWIQGAMLQVQGVLGPDWDQHYMTAPIWRFSLAAGLCGQQKMLGVLMPSVDRVGRRFPLTLATAVTTPGPAQLDHFNEAELFHRLEDLALDALEDGMTRDAIEERLAGIPSPEFRAAAPVRRAGNTLVLTQAAPGGFLPELASGLLAGTQSAPSIWSAVVNDVPRLMICDGLPEGPEAQGLFQLNAPIWSEARPV
ncbi:type VI secretion system-associated protein TagF [Albibacillus kandeliae]|uniref:type VI secretion system-associated protein TagF n=1 Tax=Albibacillus kandeliae TaxID=2174228 RepID=UPI000D69641C|nr:type VI secretion system-associated protein TagF [Albibacillus kandeliae]